VKEYFDNNYNYESVVTHNDLHNENILTKNNEIAGIIDFSDMCFSDYHSDFVFLYKDIPFDVFIMVVDNYTEITKRYIDIGYIKLSAKMFLYNKIGQKIINNKPIDKKFLKILI
jgi:aminoglycoside phosphotransferase (APT) family kinase protein